MKSLPADGGSLMSWQSIIRWVLTLVKSSSLPKSTVKSNVKSVSLGCDRRGANAFNRASFGVLSPS